MPPYGGSSSLPGEGVVYCTYKSKTRSPPPRGGEPVSLAVSLVSPPPVASPSASYVVSHWLSAASGYPGKDTEIFMTHYGAFKYCVMSRGI